MSLQTQILAHFASKNIHLSPGYIATLVSSIHPSPTTCTPALFATVENAFLQSPLQQCSAPQSYLPIGLPNKHNITVPGPTLVQIIYVRDIGASRLTQLEALEKWLNEKGPQGRRVVDLPNEDDGEENGVPNDMQEGPTVGKNMCKVLLEDGQGERVYGMEIKSIEEIRVGMPLGCKVVLERY